MSNRRAIKFMEKKTFHCRFDSGKGLSILTRMDKGCDGETCLNNIAKKWTGNISSPHSSKSISCEASGRFLQSRASIFRRPYVYGTPSVPLIWSQSNLHLGEHLAFSQNVMSFVQSSNRAIYVCITLNLGEWVWMFIFRFEVEKSEVVALFS